MSATSALRAPAPLEANSGGYSHRQILVIISGLMLAMLLASLDQTIVSTALTRISEDFQRPELYSWVVTSYLLTSTATTPLYGKLSDLFGRKRIFQFAIVVFLVGSALSGASQSMYQLIAFRAVQGLGAGGLMSLALAIVGDVIPPRDRGRYQGYFGAVFGTSSVLGPLVGGFLVDGPGWRWVFYVNLPIGILALVVIDRVLKLDTVHRAAKIDVLGATLMVGGVSSMLIGVSQIGSVGRLDTSSLVYLLVGAALLVAFVGWEARATEPILPIRLFRNDVFRVTTSLSLITGAVMFGAIIFLPQYMQRVRDVSPTMSGLRLLPLLAGLLLTSIGVGRLLSRGSTYKKFVVGGTGLLIVGTTLLATIRTDTNFWVLSGIIFVVGASLGSFMQTIVVATQNAVDRTEMGVATSAVTFFRTLGGAIGASVLGAVLIAQERATQTHEVSVATAKEVAAHGNTAASRTAGETLGMQHAFVNGMDRAYLWAIPVTVLAFAVAWLLREVRLRSSNTPTNRKLAESAAAL